MRTKAQLLVVLAVATLLVVGCDKQATKAEPVAHETSLDEHLRWRDEAQPKVLIEVSNDVVGINRIVKCDVQDYDEDVKKWKAEVTVDFMNKIGGIERTNLPYVFFAGSHDSQNKRSLLVVKDATEMKRQ